MKNRKSTMGKKLLLLCFIIFAIFFVVSCSISYKAIVVSQRRMYKEKLVQCSDYVATYMSQYDILSFKDGKAKEDLEECQGKLYSLSEKLNLKYIYVYIPAEDGNSLCNIIFIDSDEKVQIQTGEKIQEHVPEEAMQVYKGVLDNETSSSDNQYSHVVSGYAPVIDEKGSIQAVVGVDITYSKIVLEGWKELKGEWINFWVLSMIIFLILYGLNRNYLIEPIKKISTAMEHFVEQKREQQTFQKLETKRKDELGSMVQSFNAMGEEMEQYLQQIKQIYVQKEKEKVEGDVAKKIQKDSLPDGANPFSEDSRFLLAASMDPARTVGGDFYDFFYVGDHRLCCVIGDVSGKGMTAALFMMRSMTLIKERVIRGLSLKEVFESVNQELCYQNETGMFVTVFMGILDLSSGRFQYANAGHNPPYWRKFLGDYQELKTNISCPLGAFEDEEYVQEQIQLDIGDRMFLYTDGINEAMNEKREQFGIPRMVKWLNDYKWEPLHQRMAKLKQEISSFRGEMPQSDDMTMLWFSYEGNRKSCYLNAKKDGLAKMRKTLDEAIGETHPLRKPLHLMLEEIFVNIVSYAYKGVELSEREAFVYFICEKEKDDVKLLFLDQGISFNPLQQTQPDLEQDIEMQAEGGLGIYLIEQMADEMDYQYIDGYNILKIIKNMRNT